VGRVILWQLTRSTALVALVLLTVVLVLGVLAGSGSAPRRVIVQSVHRGLSVLAVSLVGAHVATVLIDPHVDVTAVDLVVPFGSSFERLATGLGTVAFDLLLMVAVTSAFRLRLGGRTWRAMHGVAYALWPVATLHAIGAGTDERATRILGLCCAAAVAVALGIRLARADRVVHVLAVAGLVAVGALTGAVL
jgi:DMSO/TMAO reductase YedYZ heme-binding membrane subunit